MFSRSHIKASPFRRIKSLTDTAQSKSTRTQGGHYDDSGNFIRDGDPFMSETGRCRVIQPSSHRNVPSDGCSTAVADPNQKNDYDYPEEEGGADLVQIRGVMDALAKGDMPPSVVFEKYKEEWNKCTDEEKQELRAYHDQLKQAKKQAHSSLGEITRPKNLNIEFKTEDDEQELHRVVGQIDDGLLGAMVNAQDGANILIGSKDGKIYIQATDDNGSYSSERSFWKQHGKLYVGNDSYEIYKKLEDGTPNPLRGKGFEIFANQIMALREVGASLVCTGAGGCKYDADNGGMNGYYTWPRVGYSGSIHEHIFERFPKEYRKKMGNSREVRDLLDMEGGKDVWQECGSTIPCHFDLTDGSRNMKALEAYAQERRNRE